MIPEGILYRVTAPHFVAGLIYCPEKKRIIYAAPIIQWMTKKDPAYIKTYFDRKEGWEIKKI